MLLLLVTVFFPKCSTKKGRNKFENKVTCSLWLSRKSLFLLLLPAFFFFSFFCSYFSFFNSLFSFASSSSSSFLLSLYVSQLDLFSYLTYTIHNSSFLIYIFSITNIVIYKKIYIIIYNELDFSKNSCLSC